jgi:hypothetical protein
MFVVANGPVIPDREMHTVGKNSPKSKVSGGSSDGAVDVFGLSPEMGGTDAVGGNDRSTDSTAFSFPLDKPVLALLGRLLVGQAVEFVRETQSAIHAKVGDQLIGYVPAAYRSRVAVVLVHRSYSALIEDIAHHTIRVRVTA